MSKLKKVICEMRVLKLSNRLKNKMVLLSLIVSVIGCGPQSLNYYSDLNEKPTAKLKGDCIQVFLGYSSIPIVWINPKVKISDEKILITARKSYWERPNIIDIKLPDPNKMYQLYWVNEDGKMIIIPIEKNSGAEKGAK
jgi:hypothetical protein